MSVSKIQKKKGKHFPSPTLLQLIISQPDIAQYFSRNAGRQGYEELALRLMRLAIQSHVSKDKHYNVAYIKHNRFLSPSQKQAVSPKVTEIIPIPQQSHKIYGKPKVVLDDQNFDLQKEAQVNLVSRQTEFQTYPKSQQSLYMVMNKEKEQENQAQPYLSPCSKPQRQPKQVPKKLKGAGKSSRANLNIESNYRTTVREERTRQVCSPQVGRKQNFQNVESRIKVLVDRDKKRKQVQKQLQEQSQKIDKLEERQEKLLMRQYDQVKELGHVKSQPHLACCCQSDQEMGEILKTRTNASDMVYQRALANIKSNLTRQKQYKINSNAVYPISSSSQSEDSSEEVVVAAHYR